MTCPLPTPLSRLRWRDVPYAQPMQSVWSGRDMEVKTRKASRCSATYMAVAVFEWPERHGIEGDTGSQYTMNLRVDLSTEMIRIKQGGGFCGISQGGVFLRGG
jgi:hypothetical protein